jgi:hypothetical protein
MLEYGYVSFPIRMKHDTWFLASDQKFAEVYFSKIHKHNFNLKHKSCNYRNLAQDKIFFQIKLLITEITCYLQIVCFLHLKSVYKIMCMHIITCVSRNTFDFTFIHYGVDK